MGNKCCYVIKEIFEPAFTTSSLMHDVNQVTCYGRSLLPDCIALPYKINTLQLLYGKFCLAQLLKSQKRPTRKVFVYKIQVNPIHTIFDMAIIVTSWMGNGAVLKSSSQWQLKES